MEELDLSMNQGGPKGLAALAERYLFPTTAAPLHAPAADAARRRLPDAAKSNRRPQETLPVEASLASPTAGDGGGGGGVFHPSYQSQSSGEPIR